MHGPKSKFVIVRTDDPQGQVVQIVKNNDKFE